MLEVRIAVRIADVFSTEAWVRIGAPALASLSYLLSRWLH